MKDWNRTPGATNASEVRHHPSWIEGFLALTEGTQSPYIFRKWAAVAAIAGALERKIWVRAWKRTLYPNVYVLLTGGPGVGKTDVLREVEKFWHGLSDLHVAPSSVSRASLIDRLVRAERQILRPGDPIPLVRFNSLQCVIAELGTFMVAYEGEFMSTLNHLFDCVRYSEEKRASIKEPLVMPAPQLTIAAATTPSWLGNTLPEYAWAEGFASRLMMIYSGTAIRLNPWADDEFDEGLEESLLADLHSIHAMYGPVRFAEDVAEAFKTWYMAGMPPTPEHPKLEHYLPRRNIHFLKLCMIFSAARSNECIIRMEDYQGAQEMLMEAETIMPDVFRAIKSSGDANVIDEAFSFIWQTFQKEAKPIAEHRIIHFLMQRMPSHAVSDVLDIMVKSNIIRVARLGTGGLKLYEPVPRDAHDT